MTAAEIIQTLRADLEPYVAAKRGAVSVARDPYHVIELLYLTPDGFLVVINFAGDEDLGQSRFTGVARLKLDVIVSQQRGLAAEPGIELLESSEPGDDPLFILVSKIRARCRAIQFPDDGTTSGKLWFKRSSVVPGPDNTQFNAYRLEFEINGAISEET